MGRRRFYVGVNGGETDDLRCRRSDGRRWRCPMPALPNTGYCEHHRFFSARNAAGSQKAVSCLESPKPNGMLDLNLAADSDPEKHNPTFDPLSRSRRKKRRRDNGDNSELRAVCQSSDRSVVLAAQSEMDSDHEKIDPTADSLATGEKRRRREKADPVSKDLIRMAVKRQMKRKEEREGKKRSEEQPEVRRELPNGVMAISPSPAKSLSNVDRLIDKKIGLGFTEVCSLRRRFRSKNVEKEPLGLVKKFPRVLGRSRNACHGCGENGMKNCISKSCKTCKSTGVEGNGFEETTHCQDKFSRIRYTDYLICQLLPVFKQLNWEQIFELEIEANIQGKRLAGVQLQVIECSQNVQFKCNYCRISIVSLHRSCSKCYYKLCLNCCREIRGESFPDTAEIVTCDYTTTRKAYEHVDGTPNGIRKELPLEHHCPLMRERTDKNRDETIPCPPNELGGCGAGMLNVKLLLPFGWTLQPESAEDPEGCTNGG